MGWHLLPKKEVVGLSAPPTKPDICVLGVSVYSCLLLLLLLLLLPDKSPGEQPQRLCPVSSGNAEFYCTCHTKACPGVLAGMWGAVGIYGEGN